MPNLLSRILKRFTSQQYAQSTVNIQSNTAKAPPFNERAALAAFGSWVSAAATLNANAVANVPLRLYVREKGGKKALWPTRKVSPRRKRYLMGDAQRCPHRVVMTKAAQQADDMVEVIDHPILRSLYTVNPWMSGFEFLHTLSLHLDLTGNAYTFMATNDAGGPGEFWLLPPDQTFVIPDRERWIAGYEYRPRSGADNVTFEPEEIAHFRLPNPRSQWYGMGGVEKMWWAINANNAAVIQDFRMYENGARPDYAIIIRNAAANADALDRYSAMINKELAGVHKSRKPWTMTGDVQIQPLNFNPKDMMGREDLVEEIAAAFSVPVSLLKGNDPNRANAEVGYASWREMAIAPRCRLIEEVLNQNVLPRYDLGEDAMLAFDDPVPGNEDRDSQIADRRLKAGVVTINEVRTEIGDEPSDDPMADRLLFNGQPLGASPLSAFGGVSPMGEAKPGNETQDDGEDSPDDPPEPPAPPEKGVDLDALAEKVAAMVAAKIAPPVAKKCSCCAPAKTVHKGEVEDEQELRRFIRSLDAVMQQQAEAIVEAMRAANATSAAILNAVQTEIAAKRWTTALYEAAEPFVRWSFERGGAAGAATINVEPPSFDYANPEVQRNVERATTRLASGVNETTQVRVSALLGTALDEGKTIDEIAKQVKETIGVDGARAETIARTESARAYESGQVAAWKESGVVVGKKWLLAPDACEYCRAIARKAEVLPLDASFAKVGDTIDGVAGGTLTIGFADVDGPPLHPGCRCSTVPVMQGEL